ASPSGTSTPPKHNLPVRPNVARRACSRTHTTPTPRVSERPKTELLARARPICRGLSTRLCTFVNEMCSSVLQQDARSLMRAWKDRRHGETGEDRAAFTSAAHGARVVATRARLARCLLCVRL